MDSKQAESIKINIIPDIITKAEEGDATAQLKLGKVYYDATSVENNDTIAFKWTRLSAEQGNMKAQFRLGDLYALGYGAAKSWTNSYEWYTKAAIQGYKKALIRIHNLYQEDIKMHGRGQINSLEPYFQVEFRELFEWRLNKYKPMLNRAISYYTDLFERYQSSDQNDVYIQLNLAFLYQHGYGTKKCTRWAFEYYSLAADQGNADAQYNLGYLYQQHKDKKFNYRHAFKWYTRSAQGGNTAAQRCLAYFYLKGLATNINYNTALFWYTKAAESGDSQSQVILGKLYRKGEHVRQDISMAVKWYTLAARQGNIVAQNCLSQLFHSGILQGIYLEKDMLDYLTEDSMDNRLFSKLTMDISKLEVSSEFKQLTKLFKRALIGDGPAMYEVGLKYYNGSNSFPQDKDTGIKWIKNAAKRKHKDAQFMMADIYKKGDSIEQDYYKSYIWYKRIAKQKDADAQCKVGIMYNKGLGVRKDPLEASKWFTWALDQENSDAQIYFGELRLRGYGIRQDKKEAKVLFYKSVHQKNKQACFELGKMIFEGTDGLDKHLETGLKLLEFSAKHDNVDAQLFLGNTYEKGTDVQRDIQKSIGFFTKAADSGNEKAQYKMATVYLNGTGVDPDYIEAYQLFKQAKENGNENSNWLFQIPIKFDPNIKGYSKVIAMFTKVTGTSKTGFAYNIGFLYEHGMRDYYSGQNVDVDYNEAKQWYVIASGEGDSRADYRLGIMYEYGKGVKQNMVTAIDSYNKAADKENPNAMYRLAYMYLNGYGVIQNYLKAFCLFTKASNMGHKEATNALMVFEQERDLIYKSDDFTEDLKIPTDRKNVLMMMEKATDKDYARLQYRLGVMYERNNDNPNAFKWLSQAATIGITDAYYRLGVMYEEGRGVEQKYSKAADMYEKATEKDHNDACFRLGQLYRYGQGIRRDYLKAYSFYKKAADMNHKMAGKVLNITLEDKIQAKCGIKRYFLQPKEYKSSLKMCKYVAKHGDTDVQFKVGFTYENNYTKPDYKKAFKWYSMAAKNSHKEATYHLGLLYEKGLGVSKNYDKAIQLYNQAYQLGSDDALHRLGTIYHYGKGVEFNPVKAMECYTLSAKLGNPEYQCKLGKLYEEGELVQKSLIEALKWYTKAYQQGHHDIEQKLHSFYEDKPYETFFFERVFRNLSVASCNYFGLDESYDYKCFGVINNRLGFMCFFGIGTNKNLDQSLKYFLKEYTDQTRLSIQDFGFFEYDGFSFSQKFDILNEFEKVEECMGQFNQQELYELGMIFYNGIVQMQNFNYDCEKKVCTPIEGLDLKYPSQQTVIEKDYLKAFNYLKRAADGKNPEALFQVGIMYHYGYGVQKDCDEGNRYFELIPYDKYVLLEKVAILFHTYKDMQNFSMGFVYYDRLEKSLSEDRSMSSYERYLINQPITIGLGLLYEHGDGVEQDYKKALDHYERLVEEKNIVGFLRLGLMHYYGKGVPVDYKKALDLFNETMKGCYFGYEVPYVYDQSNLQASNDDDSKRKLVYSTKTHREIQGEGFYYCGLMYKYGQGIQKDKSKANGYLREAFIRGCQRAEIETKD